VFVRILCPQVTNFSIATTKLSQRITVRQLESLIRLGEALAKLHGETEVTGRYIRRARQLLEDSIIGVDSDAIELEEDTRVSQTAVESAPQTTDSQRTKIHMDFDKYQKICKAVVTRLHQQSDSQATTDDAEPTVDGMRLDDLVNWYLETIEDELDSEEDLLRETKLVQLVLKRLYMRDNVLIRLTTDNVDDDQNPVLVVHPNYLADSY
jgi:DNA replication licensing factor MCM6